jgi:hypothetical protein
MDKPAVNTRTFFLPPTEFFFQHYPGFQALAKEEQAIARTS